MLNVFTHCPRRTDRAMMHYTVCIYNCDEKAKCSYYTAEYEQFKECVIEEKYLEKYGEPKFPLPNALKPKKKKHKKKVVEHNGCPKHPTYIGKKKSKNGCHVCQEIYEKYQEQKRKQFISEGKCPEHPTYQGIRKPKMECRHCWDIYNKNHESDEVKPKPKVNKGCADHPTYGGKRRPRTECKVCWKMYNEGRN